MYGYYRWFNVLIMTTILCMGGYLYILPAYEKQNLLSQEKIELVAELKRLQKYQEQQVKLSSKKILRLQKSGKLSNPLSIVISLIEANGLQLISYQQSFQESDNELQQVIIVGGYGQISSFIAMLLQYAATIFLADFDFKVVENNLLQAKLTLFIDHKKLIHEAISKIHLLPALQNPFCDFANQGDFYPKQNKLLTRNHQQFSLNQVRFVGFIETAHHRQVLLAFPDGSELVANVGDVLGVEQGVVQVINREYVLFLLPNKKHFSLQASIK